MAWSLELACFPSLLVFALGCGTPSTPPDDGGAGSSSATTTTTGQTSTQTDASGSQSSGADGTDSGGPAMCADGATGYRATAEVLDEGLGPTGAPVTIDNCTNEVAYVQQDCCYGAAFMLERKDTAEDPWRMSLPSMDCDCEGPIEPLVIEPLSRIVIETQPAAFDAEPLCEDPYVAIYRWTFLVADQPECRDCWQEVPTNEMNWYCEG